MSHHIPIETFLGRLDGRDCIFLDGFSFDDPKGTLVLKGSINGNLCTARQSGHFIPYRLKFRGVLAIKMVELDSCDWDFESAFDEVHDSQWVASLGGKVTVSHRHFFVQTYDYVFDIACAGYEFEAQSVDAEQSDAPKTSAQSNLNPNSTPRSPSSGAIED